MKYNHLNYKNFIVFAKITILIFGNIYCSKIYKNELI
jgi:hypothetical protein